MTEATPTRVDLHCHTARSDGVHEPGDLYGMLAASGMRLVAITDHDTTDAVRELTDAGVGLDDAGPGPRIVAGVEINTTAGTELPGASGLERRDRELHLIGLGIDPIASTLLVALAEQRRRRLARRDAILARLADLGIDVREHLPTNDDERSAGRPHIAAALVAGGHARDVQDAFERYLGVDGPAYVPRPGMGPREAIETIHTAGGLAILAHRADAPDHPRLMAALIDAGLDGIEVHHSSFDAEQVARVGRFADDHHLLPSGGTDYHGLDDMTYATALARTHVPDAVGERILGRLGR